MSHDPAHDEILDAVACGDLTADDPKVRALAESSPEFRERLEADALIQRTLNAESREAEALLAEATEPVEDEEAILAGFRAALGELDSGGEGGHGGQPTPGARRFVALAGVLAAAAALVVLLTQGKEPEEAHVGPPIEPGTTLSSTMIECLAPLGAWADDEAVEFRWRFGAVAQPEYLLRVFDGEEELVLERDGLDEPRYAPSDAEQGALHGAIRWEVIALDATGTVVASGEALAEL